MVIALGRIRFHLDRPVDTNRLGNPLVQSSGMGLASLGTGQSVVERTDGTGKLHHSFTGTGRRVCCIPRAVR